MLASEKRLRNVLLANALFSFISGVLISWQRAFVTDFLGVKNESVLLWLGLGLIIFSATVFHASRRKRLYRAQVNSIIIQDWGWVVGSALVIALQAWNLTHGGYWLIAGVALVVADFAIFQRYFLRKMRTTL